MRFPVLGKSLHNSQCSQFLEELRLSSLYPTISELTATTHNPLEIWALSCFKIFLKNATNEPKPDGPGELRVFCSRAVRLFNPSPTSPQNFLSSLSWQNSVKTLFNLHNKRILNLKTWLLGFQDARSEYQRLLFFCFNS